MQPMQVAHPFDAVEADWAWSEWAPTAEQPWDARMAAHLYRRAAFGANSQTLHKAAEASLNASLDKLFSPPPTAGSFQEASQHLVSSVLAGNDPRALSVWWLHDMLNSPTPLSERMTLFWHGHFATGAEKVKDAQLMLDQNRLLRNFGLGDISKLVHGISKDPAMLIYLDSAVNRKAHPNENFARELVELFCLGEGNYSEKDVQELARCFTGWEVRRQQFRFNQYQHDGGKKSLLGIDDIESGEQAVSTILKQPQAARFIVHKLFRFYMADEPTPPAALLEPLALQLITDQWQISGVLRKMLGSQLMFSPLVRGRKVRSPIDWICNWLNSCEITTSLKKISQSLNELGQALFYPPNVKGWDGGRAWINSSTLVGRTNLISQLLRDETTRWAGGDIKAFFRRQQVTSVPSLIDWVEQRLSAVPLSSASRDQLTTAMMRAGGIDQLGDCLVLAAALPELQLA